MGERLIVVVRFDYDVMVEVMDVVYVYVGWIVLCCGSECDFVFLFDECV